MTRRILACGTTIGFLLMSLASNGNATAQGECAPNLRFEITPVLARGGETFPARVILRESPINMTTVPDHRASGFYAGVVLYYPEGIAPEITEPAALVAPNGILRAVTGSDIAFLDRREERRLEISLNVDGSREGGPYVVDDTGLLLEVPFRSEDSQGSGEAEIELSGGRLDAVSGDCWEAETVFSGVEITPPGVRGDIDADGRVTVLDAHRALRLITGALAGSRGVWESAKTTDGSGAVTPTTRSVTIMDVIAILRKAAGIG